MVHPLPASAESSHPGAEIDLSHWGLGSPSEIGYLSVGILHKEKGDVLILYDVRREKPVIAEPAIPKSRIPAFDDGIFILDDFQGKNTNRLNGYFNAFSKPPSESKVTIDRMEDDTSGLRFSYRCAPGSYAGFRIQLFDFKATPFNRVFLDATPFKYLTFSVKGETGGEQVRFQVADAVWEKKEDSVQVGEIGAFLPEGKVTRFRQRAWIPLEMIRHDVKRDALANLVFLAGSGKGEIELGDVAFAVHKEVRFPAPSRKTEAAPASRKGLWFWNTEELFGDSLRQNQVLEFCRITRITDLFLQIPYKLKTTGKTIKVEWSPSGLRPILSLFHGSGIRVFALDGAPDFALREKHHQVLAVLDAVIRYNRSANSSERFDGVRYDVEPYLLPNFSGVEKESVMSQYLELLRKIKLAVEKEGLEFGVDIPFWFDGKNEFFEPAADLHGRPLSEWILDIVDNVGIMDYRTEAYGTDGLITHAADELRYAAKNGKTVFVGLETFELPDETMFEFGKGSGDSVIEISSLGKTRVRLRWIASGKPVVKKEGFYLAQTGKTFIPSTKLSFARKSIRDLHDVMKKAGSQFHEFASFRGFAVHYYESYRDLWAKETQR
ncbi:MAG: hypothetical protein AB1659_07880 [Thermodesulfobacteriota bacterium]